MKDYPLISVIIPVYKVEKYLNRCVESIVSQSYQNIEIILVDDGSPDNCPSICDEYALKDKRVKVIHKENGGLTSARNFGIKKASGKYVSFIDSDDWVEPDIIEHMLTLLFDNNASVVSVDLYTTSNYNDRIVNSSDEIIDVMDKSQYFRFLSEKSCYMCAKLYDINLFDNIPLPDSLSFSEDIAYNYFIAKKVNKAVSSSYKYYYYFRHPESIMSGCISENMIVKSLECYDWMKKCVSDESEEIKAYYAYAKVMRDFFLINSIIRNNTCNEYFSVLRDDVISFERDIIANSKGLFTKNHIYGYKILKYMPDMYKKSIQIRKRIRGY